MQSHINKIFFSNPLDWVELRRISYIGFCFWDSKVCCRQSNDRKPDICNPMMYVK